MNELTTEYVREDYAWYKHADGMDQDEAAAEFDAWILRVKAEAWDEGFSAGELDVLQHERHGWDEPCINNPYRA